MIVYPDENYNSWISEDNAFEYFENRLNSDAWDSLTNGQAALITAFHSLAELNLDIVFVEAGIISTDVYSTSEVETILQDLQFAQCEQALHELNTDLDTQQIVNLSLIGLSVKMPDKKPERFSPRAMAILRSYVIAPSVTRYR